MKKTDETDKEVKKIIILSIIAAVLFIVIIILVAKIFDTRKMIQTQTIQTLALQKALAEEPEEGIIDNFISEAVVLQKGEEDEEIEETVKFGDKEIAVPKIKVAKVNDAEDKQRRDTSTSPSTTTDEAIDLFQTKDTSVGIDVSKWQGNIDWAKVRADGIEFVMIRVGYRGYSEEGKIVMDPYFTKNITGAISYGLPVGIYFFSMAKNEEEAVQEAAWTVNAIRKYKITLPVAYDFESFGQYRVSDVSNEQMNNNAVAFLNHIKSKGYQGMMYGSKNALKNRWNMGKFSSFKVWLAHYTEKTDYAGRYNMWQYSSTGKVDGINGNVDMNIAYAKYQLQEVVKKDKAEENMTPWDTRD